MKKSILTTLLLLLSFSVFAQAELYNKSMWNSTKNDVVGSFGLPIMNEKDFMVFTVDLQGTPNALVFYFNEAGLVTKYMLKIDDPTAFNYMTNTCKVRYGSPLSFDTNKIVYANDYEICMLVLDGKASIMIIAELKAFRKEFVESQDKKS